MWCSVRKTASKPCSSASSAWLVRASSSGRWSSTLRERGLMYAEKRMLGESVHDAHRLRLTKAPSTNQLAVILRQSPHSRVAVPMTSVASVHEQTIQSAKGLNILVRAWLPETAPRGGHHMPRRQLA